LVPKDIFQDGPRLHKKGLQSRINVTDNIFKGSDMSISLKKMRENRNPTVSEVINRRLKGTSRGLGYLAAYDAAMKLGFASKERISITQPQ